MLPGAMARKVRSVLQREITRMLAARHTRRYAPNEELAIEGARLFWDEGPDGATWVIRYRDVFAEKKGAVLDVVLDVQEDARLEELATAVNAKVHRIPGNGKIKVLRGEGPCGSITLTKGEVSAVCTH